MPLVVIPPTEASVLVDATPSPLDRAIKLDANAQLGFGLIRPFRRDEKLDFANAGGAELVKACVGQILGQEGASPDNPQLQGELEWAPEQGSLLHLLRHQKNDLILQELGRVYVIDCLRRWEPRIRIREVVVTRESNDEGEQTVFLIRLRYDVISTNQSSNQVLFENIDQTVTKVV